MATDLEQMVYFDEQAGELLVSKSHAFQAEVRSYLQLLRNKGVKFSIAQVEMDVIDHRRNQYASSNVEFIERSEMQRVALDIFRRAVHRRASDIHIRVSSRAPTKVYFRVHNDLSLQEQHPENWGKYLCSAIYTAMSDVSDATYEVLSRQDARISKRNNLPPGLDGIRVATSPQVDGNIMVLRLLYNDEGQSNDIGVLGYSEQQKNLFAIMKRRPTGINIIAGPTGSGKSTTLQRTLLAIHAECKGAKHIITVEDPPEYPMEGIVQTPVANANSEEERSLAFQEAIKATMRLDPNIIMIGEVRDPPSARLAVQAAMTGHQVWTTVHANTAFGIVDRMIDLGVASNAMCDATLVTGLICQRLLKVLCPHCKRPLSRDIGRYPAADLERILPSVELDKVHVIGPGCEACAQTGIAGRTAVAEIIVPDAQLMGFIKSGERDRARGHWINKGGVFMLDIARQKVNAGLCDPFHAEEEVGPLEMSGRSLVR